MSGAGGELVPKDSFQAGLHARHDESRLTYVRFYWLRGESLRKVRILLLAPINFSLHHEHTSEAMTPSVPNTPAAVRHNIAAHCFEIVWDDHRSVADYTLAGNRVTFTHTFVPSELRGRGVAEQLVRAALGWARQEGRQVVPVCSYVAKFIERHVEYRDLLAGN